MILSLCASASAAERDVERRVNELLARMTLAEKIGQLVQINASGGQLPDALKERLRQGRLGSMLNEIVPAASLEIQRIAVEESRLGIPLLMGRDVIHGYRTIFPIPLAQAAAWNPQLVTDCAAVAAEEAAAAGFQWTFAPMMDIARDPRWGRIAEGFGEDTHLATVLAAASTLARCGSSPNPSAIRPQRGSRAMSIIGAKVHWKPAPAASSAATAAAAATRSGSHAAAWPSGIGKMVR